MSIQTIGIRSVFAARISRPAMWIVAASLITLYHAAAMPSASATTIDNFANAGPSNPGNAYYIDSNPTTHTMTLPGNPVVTSNTNSLTIVDNVATNVAIGGVRTTAFSVLGTLSMDSVNGLIGDDLSVQPGGLDGLAVNTNGRTQTTVTSTYLAGGVSPAIDLTSGGTQSGIDIHVLSTDQPLSITVGLSNSTQNWSFSTVAPSLYDSFTKTFLPQDVIIPFSSFHLLSGPTSPGAGTSVNQITFTYNGGASPLANIDFTIGSINTTTANTPEPGSAVLLVIGVVAMGGMAVRQARRRGAMGAPAQSV